MGNENEFGRGNFFSLPFCLFPKEKGMIFAMNIQNLCEHAYEDFCNSITIPKFSKEEFVQSHSDDSDHILKWECKGCGTFFDAPVDFSLRKNFGCEIYAKCPKCYPHSEILISNSKNEFFEFLKMNYQGKIQENIGMIFENKVLEFDVFIPEKNLAIDFVGLYWHADEMNPNAKNEILEKTNRCSTKGIRLIHIFENEWLYKKEIVKSRLNHLLRLTPRKIVANKCTVKEVSFYETKEFLEKNSLQEFVFSSVNLGLYFNDELVSLATFRKSNHKKYKWQFLRFCSKTNTFVLGGISKLFKFFSVVWLPSFREDSTIISYADRRWHDRKIHEQLGFKLIEITEPHWWYFKTNDLYLFNQLDFRKKDLNVKLENYCEDLDIAQNMYRNGYYKIFDCGNFVFGFDGKKQK